MKRRNFFKLLSASPLIPLMPVKKKEEWKSWGTNYIPGQTNYTTLFKEGVIDNVKVMRSKFSKVGSVEINLIIRASYEKR